jgi:tRNA A-37 threonylcarbamoyl transferase component Bud32
MTPSHFRLFARTEQAALLELPWPLRLEDWPRERTVDIERGIGRHVVRFVELRGAFYALKELPPPLAEREYRLLGALEDAGVPAVAVVGVANERISAEGEELPEVLITRYLEFALPYRLILSRMTLPATEPSIRAALSELLVRLHIAGFFWGDCSLSNALFRRDAGALSAYLVDAETSEMHERLSDGQRQHDLDIAEENLAGELYDLAAELGRDAVDDPFEFAASVRTSYDALWDELTRDEVFSIGEGHRLEERLRKLNDLGFDVEEVDLVSTGDEVRLLLHSKVVEPGHHRRRLLRLTGLDAQENQARRLLNDLTRYRAWLERSGKKPVSDTAAAGRWLSEVFEPAIAAIPPELRGRRAAAEIFHELLEHRWFLSERAGKDVGLAVTIPSYIETVLRPASDEKLPLAQS